MRSPNRQRACWVAAVLVVIGAAASPAAWPVAGRHRLEIREMVFRPVILEVARGDTLVWVNHDVVPHTVTAPEASWDSGEIPPGGTFRWVAASAGTIRYLCRYHPTMSGTLNVR